MVEIYLFVNPLGGVCLEIEKEIIQLSVNDKKKIQLRFIPLLNMKTINEFLSRQHIPINDIKRRNRIFEDLYSAALDYKDSYKAEKRPTIVDWLTKSSS